MTVGLRGSSISADNANLTMYADLLNDGEGSAVDWRVTIESGQRAVRLAKPIETESAERRTADGWAVDWQSSGADDVIGPGLSRQIILVTDVRTDETVVARFRIRARRMKDRMGEIRVTFPAGQPKPSITVI